MINESIQDIEIQYFYTENFEWKDVMMSETYQGHPRKGQVYRAILNEYTKNTKVILSDKPAIALVINEVTPDFTCKFVAVNPANLLDLDLPETELDRIIAWQEKDNKDLKKVIEPPSPQEQKALEPILALAEYMQNQSREERQALKHAKDIMGNLFVTNSILYDIILSLAEIMTEHTVMMHTDPANLLALHPTHSTGVNLSQTYAALSRYTSSNRRINLNTDDLMDAITALLTEYESRILNEK